MRKVMQFTSVFLAGALAAGLLCWYGVIRPTNRALMGLHSSQVSNMSGTALQLSRGDGKGALEAIEAALPSHVQSLCNGGRDEQTLQALRIVKQFYQQSGKPVPAAIARTLSSL